MSYSLKYKFFYVFCFITAASPKMLAIASGQYHIVEYINKQSSGVGFNDMEVPKTVVRQPRGRLNSKG